MDLSDRYCLYFCTRDMLHYVLLKAAVKADAMLLSVTEYNILPSDVNVALS